jgi:hypothetical protein
MIPRFFPLDLGRPDPPRPYETVTECCVYFYITSVINIIDKRRLLGSTKVGNDNKI